MYFVSWHVFLSAGMYSLSECLFFFVLFTVRLKSLENRRKKIYVQGAFIYTQPWWEISMDVEPAYNANYAVMMKKPKFRYN